MKGGREEEGERERERAGIQVHAARAEYLLLYMSAWCKHNDGDCRSDFNFCENGPLDSAQHPLGAPLQVSASDLSHHEDAP